MSSDALSIYHVDDDPELGALVKRYVESGIVEADCAVTTETDPRSALETLRADGERFDCVVSDYDMPDMNGIEFLEAVRETHPRLPFLMFSGREPNDIAASIIRAGLSDFLRKGAGTDQYTMLVRRVEHAVASEGQFDPETETELDGVGVVGVDERFDAADETYASLYEYSAGEVVGKHWSELHPDSEVEHIRNHVLPVVRDGGTWSGHSRGLRADGSTFTESKMVTALDDGRLLIAVSELDETDFEDAPGHSEA